MQDTALEDILFYWIDRTNKRLRQYSQQAFKKHGFDITVDQWLVLKRVSDSDGAANQSELAELVAKDNASVTRILDHLVKKDLVVREPNPQDRRSFVITMTHKGKAYYERILPVVKDLRKQGIKDIDRAGIEQVKQVLDQIYQNMS